MTELERILAKYGCSEFCYNYGCCEGCWFRQHVQYELDRLKSQHPVCKSETKINVLW